MTVYSLPTLFNAMVYKLLLNEQAIIESYSSGKDCKSIANEHNCSDGTIRNVLIRNNIKLRTNSEVHKCQTKTAISSEQKQVIEGLLLGDGSVFQRSATANFRLRSVQQEFINHVKAILPFRFNIYTEEPAIRTFPGNKKYMCKKSYVLESSADISLNDVRKAWYPNNKKIVPNLQLSSLLCKYWFYSDGYTSWINENCVILGLCTNSFTKDECLWLRKELHILGCDFNIARKVNGYILQARKKDSVNGFLEYIGDPELQCYAYKWKRHKGRHCRWR